MKEKPILFSGPMVRAILAGTKTQTRRIMKPQPHPDFLKRGLVDAVPQWPVQDGVRFFMADGMSELVSSPYCPGNRLWVRETFYNDLPEEENREHVYYRADGECCDVIPECQCADVGKPNWNPSIHMPRWACRLTLEVTGVRVERLQSITSIDVQQEGIVASPPKHWYHASDGYEQYRNLWDKLNRKRKGGIYAWDKNPFVWVVKFKKME